MFYTRMHDVENGWIESGLDIMCWTLECEFGGLAIGDQNMVDRIYDRIQVALLFPQ